MTIDITSIRNFNPQAYDAAEKAYIRQTGGTSDDFANKVLTMAQNALLDVNDIFTLVSRELPPLENPVTAQNYPGLSLIPTLGAVVNALFVDLANSERKQISEERIAATKELIAKLDKEA